MLAASCGGSVFGRILASVLGATLEERDCLNVGTNSASVQMQMQMQMQPPSGVAEDLVRNALGFRGTASDGDASSG